MLQGIALRNDHHTVVTEAPVQRGLRHGSSVCLGHLIQHAARITIADTLNPTCQRAVGDDADLVDLAIGQELGRSAIDQVKANLVRDNRVLPHRPLGTLQLRQGKIANSDESHLSGLHEFLDRTKRFFHRNALIRFMELVEVDIISLKP